MYMKPSTFGDDRYQRPTLINYNGITDSQGEVHLHFNADTAFSKTYEASVSSLYMDISNVNNIKQGQYSVSARDLSSNTTVTREVPEGRVVTLENLATLLESTLFGMQFSYTSEGNLVAEGSVNKTYTLPIVLARCLGFLNADKSVSALVRKLNNGNATIATRSTENDGVANAVDVTFLTNGNGKCSLLTTRDRNCWNYVSPYSIQTLFLYCDLLEPVVVGAGFFEHLVNVPFPETADIVSRTFSIPTWQRVKQKHTLTSKIKVCDSVGRALPGITVNCNVVLQRRIFT